jgi:acetylornithine deacetylase/succinyl-diaminopimelate desuccinylase-like protein
VAAIVDEVTDLLQQLIRNGCVNDGTPASGQEVRNANLLNSYLEGTAADIERYRSSPGRDSLVARIEGRDRSAPSLLLMGHTDVVPVNPDHWRRDPFGGELVDGEVWGRGAVDMLNETASMAVAFRRLLEDGFRPSGDLTYFAVPDEEALGTFGAKWMLDNQADAVRADYVLTESGGFEMPLPSTTGVKLPIMVGEKGSDWSTLRITGTAGHGSMPLRTDNALVKAAEVVRRLNTFQPETKLPEIWTRFVDAADLPDDLRALLLDPARIEEFYAELPDVGLARYIHACTHTTVAPTVMRAGVKTNVIPDAVELEVDIRTLPGQTGADVEAMLREALGDLSDSVEISALSDDPSSESAIDTPLWDSIRRVTGALVPGARTVPFMIVGATDARFFRRAGSVAYGAGLFSDKIPFAEFMSMFHGNDERIDQESLRLSAEFWMGVVKDLMA